MDAWHSMLRAELRARWKAMLLLAVVVAVGAGVTIGAATASERTETAFRRSLDHGDAADLIFHGPDLRGRDEDFGMVPRDGFDAPDLDGISGLDGSASAAGIVIALPDVPRFTMAELASGADAPIDVATMFALDNRFGRTIERPSLIDGRLPDPARASEAFASAGLAEYAGWSVGSRATVDWLSAGKADPDLDASNPADVAAATATMGRTEIVIVGIGTPVRRAESDRQDVLMLTPAFGEQPGILVQYTYHVAGLADGASAAGAIAAAAGRGLVLDRSTADAIAGYQESVRPDVVSFTAFALIAGLVTVLVFGQALGREARVGGTDNLARRAIGATSGELLTVALARVSMIIVAGVGLGSLSALATSRSFLRGRAAAVDPTPGIHIDAELVAGIACALVVAYLSLCIWPAVSSARAARSSRRPSPSLVVRALTSIGSPAPITFGAQHALDRGRGQTSVPVRTALTIGGLGVALAVTAMTFTSDLRHLVATPPAYGKAWDVQVEANYDKQRDTDSSGPCLASDGICGDYRGAIEARMAMLSAVIDKAPVVTTRTAFSEESIDVNGTPVGLYSVSSGAVQPIVTDGHPPVDGEIALGPAVMRTLGVHVGDLVTANGIQLRCVGVALVPRGLPGESLGHGGIVTTSTAEQLDERAVPTGYLIRTADAADASLLLAYLGDALHGEQVGFEASPEPAQIVEYRNVLATPLALAFSLAALGAAMLIIGVTSTVHRKRREYAVLQAIGTTNRQIVGIIEAQALVSLGLVLLFGLPAGIIVANAAWTTFESRLGTVAGSGRPLAILVGAALLATVLTIAIVLPIGRRNASRRPAVGLRQE